MKTMKTIGGFFCYDKTSSTKNFFNEICDENWDLQFTMSGRCAIYHALNDLKHTDTKRCAYVPAYTCETVLAPFKKAGYQLMFYDVSKNMIPYFNNNVMDKISILSLCGYYGFSNYDKSFVQRCKDKGITIIEDTTHSIFSQDGIDPNCTYIVGSLRKWIGIPSGGFAIKTTGKFIPKPQDPDDNHLSLRKKSMMIKEENPDSPEVVLEANKIFWQAEMMLREIFSAHKSDPESIEIITRFDYQELIKKRRENYKYLLSHLKSDLPFHIVFPELKDGTVPSHFTIYTDTREQIQDYLKNKGIHSTVYWPINDDVDLSCFPEANYIYNHVLSLPCDQRYDESDMSRICSALNELNNFL